MASGGGLPRAISSCPLPCFGWPWLAGLDVGRSQPDPRGQSLRQGVIPAPVDARSAVDPCVWAAARTAWLG